MSEPGQTSEDRFLNGQLVVRQPQAGHRTGIDGVLVQAAVPAGEGDVVFEAGTGAAVAALCLARRIVGARVCAAEIDPGMSDLARANVAANDLAGRVEIVTADVTAKAAQLTASGLSPDRFDHVFANPPFHEAGKVRLPPDPGRARARALDDGGLDLWIDCLVRLVRGGGSVSVIHRPAALGMILSRLEGRCGAIAVRPVRPRVDVAASRVVVSAIKGNRAPLTLLPALVLHGAGSSYSEEAEAVLRHGHALAMSAAG